MTLLFPIPDHPTIAVMGEDARFPVHRIFCVGRNYEAHAQEMGFAADREAPFYFCKTPSAICPSGSTIPYPPGTANLHYEMEWVVALGTPAFRMSKEEAMSCVYGYACGLDLTRRDLQNAAKAMGRPWDLGKDFESAAVIAPITKAAAFGEISGQRITLRVNGETRQDQKISDMIWSVAELIADLSTFYHLKPGDLIYTGTPSGVGPVVAGDHLFGSVEGLTPVELRIGPAE